MNQKHYIVKSHHGHKFMIFFISFVLLCVGFLLGKSFSTISLAESDFRVLVVALLFLIIITMIVGVVMILHFMIEIKDLFLEVEEEIEVAVKKPKKRKK